MKQENTDRSATQGDACQSKNRQDEMQDLFRHVRILSSTDGSNVYMTDELRRLRRRLRWTYAIGAFCALWTLAIIALQFIVGGSWVITVCSVLLMLATGVNLTGQVLDLRRKVRRLADSIDSDRRERRNMLGAAMMGMLAQMAHRDRDDDDDE